MEIVLIRVDHGNSECLAQTAAEVFDEAIMPDRLAAYLLNSDNFLTVAMHAGVVIGMIMAVVHRHPDKPNELYIDEIGVTPGCRRQGVARQMLGSAIDWAVKNGCEEAWLGTEIDNTAARALYRHYAQGEQFILYGWPLSKP